VDAATDAATLAAECAAESVHSTNCRLACSLTAIDSRLPVYWAKIVWAVVSAGLANWQPALAVSQLARQPCSSRVFDMT
jgi:hypothetical protein